ncbi:MAG TPA: Uma2 family endonuclease [Planctomycetota bacterium]|nr:Uma2 family endonuclease [Planctomycetota bacterium]
MIEVVSPSNALHDLDFKYRVYKENGVPEAWFVDWRRGKILVSGAAVEEREVTSGRLASKVVPGLWIEAAWVLTDPPPPVSDCLAALRAGA